MRLMAREVFVRYLKRAGVLFPFAALLILLPPGDLTAKVAGMAAVLGALLIAQLAELVVVARRRAGGIVVLLLALRRPRADGAHFD